MTRKDNRNSHGAQPAGCGGDRDAAEQCAALSRRLLILLPFAAALAACASKERASGGAWDRDLGGGDL